MKKICEIVRKECMADMVNNHKHHAKVYIYYFVISHVFVVQLWEVHP